MQTDDLLWDGVRGEVKETEQQVLGSKGIRNILAYVHTVNKFPEFDR